MSESSSCPFCGEATRLRIFSSGFAAWHVVCLACAAQGPEVPTTEAAAVAWNRRYAEADQNFIRNELGMPEAVAEEAL